MTHNLTRAFYIIISIFLLGYTLAVGINSVFRYNNFKKEFELKNNILNKLRERKKSYNVMLSNLNKPEIWEELSRVNLKMIKPNEKLYKFYYKEMN